MSLSADRHRSEESRARRGTAVPIRSPARRLGSFFRFGLGISAGFALAVMISCAPLNRVVLLPPEIDGASFVGSARCTDCHGELTRLFPSSPHGRMARQESRWGEVAGCESCHGPGSLHVASGARELIFNPRNDPSSCFRCHIDTQMDFHLPHHHPVPEGRMSCVDCHDPHGPDIRKPAGGLAMARLNETCGACHRDQHRPFVFEHEALREGCTSCHAPHGSIHRSLLLERDAHLCLKCHAQVQSATGRIVIGKVDHTESLRLGTCYSAGCHMAVHGSNLQPKLRY
jgi:predicted CXXCH cytochrome family protein